MLAIGQKFCRKAAQTITFYFNVLDMGPKIAYVFPIVVAFRQQLSFTGHWRHFGFVRKALIKQLPQIRHRR